MGPETAAGGVFGAWELAALGATVVRKNRRDRCFASPIGWRSLSDMDKNAYAERLLQPGRLYSALDIRKPPCPVPEFPGVYAF